MISWDRVGELREEIGEDDFNEVAEMFLEEVEEVVTRLEENPDPATLEEDLHSLKGGALNLGFEALSKLCEQGERNAALQQFDAIALPDIINTYRLSKKEFLQRVPPSLRSTPGEFEML